MSSFYCGFSHLNECKPEGKVSSFRLYLQTVCVYCISRFNFGTLGFWFPWSLVLLGVAAALFTYIALLLVSTQTKYQFYCFVASEFTELHLMKHIQNTRFIRHNSYYGLRPSSSAWHLPKGLVCSAEVPDIMQGLLYNTQMCPEEIIKTSASAVHSGTLW